ncbi:MAG: Ig domain-containing protein, partial [Clostridia bacterium]|nr:Ig domain-containing protein [Clostridia bacterium]
METKNMNEEEIVLAPPTELFDEAMEIAQNTTGDEKFPFALQYDANQKEFLLSMLEMVGAIVEDDDEEGHMLNTRMNMTQLAFIKRLDCVERVRTDEGRNPFLAMEAVNPKTVEASAETLAPKAAEAMQDAQVMTLSTDEPATANADVVVASAGAMARSACSCPTNTSMATAQEISLETWVGGNICCPGAEQWFKFTVPQSKMYTIYTMGALDTEGFLYNCEGTLLAENKDYAGKINFRIKYTPTANTIYYLKVNAHKMNTGSYSLKVTEKILAESVKINSTHASGAVVLELGKTYELPRGQGYDYFVSDIENAPLSVTVSPDETTEKRVDWWMGSLSDIADISYAWADTENNTREKYPYITTKKAGIGRMYAIDWQQNGARDECVVYVGGEPVTGVKVDRTIKTMSKGDSEYVFETVLPENRAFNTNVTWSSSNSSVATVNEEGEVTALDTVNVQEARTAIITVKTEEGGFTATCTVTVDPRPKVTIEKDEEDEDFFNIIFPESESGLIWKSVGYNLYSQNTAIPQTAYERSNYNLPQDFSEKQLAFAYLFDPLGVKHYIQNYYLNHDVNGTDLLYF